MDYEAVDPLTLRCRRNDIVLSSVAIDVRTSETGEVPEKHLPSRGLPGDDKVLFHYTDQKARELEAFLLQNHYVLPS